ncbi:SOS response-associated peptidase [Paenibacillus hamazuiensis]|uniref:SOS response-associated peptidase n=1 Tax=Paenibacillus hamazuiensis TaxID=2936508 RepID=UPI002010A982|nr:SOS response-associated peptidase [Paenibacillus hamazuiensis]
MCNSISIGADVRQLTEQFRIDNVLFYSAGRREISPTESLSAILVRKNERQLDEFRWGLMPFWAKDSVWLDSRAILEKRAFQRILKKQRCVIPSSGFYITQTENKRTVRVKLTMRGGTFGIAGLYDVWRSSSGDELRTCTMLMTEANPLVAPYMNRMPAILGPEEVELWLAQELKEPLELQALLKPMDDRRMLSQAVASTNGKFSDADFDMPHPELA